MSTRATVDIGGAGFEVSHDGYPDSVIQTITDAMKVVEESGGGGGLFHRLVVSFLEDEWMKCPQSFTDPSGEWYYDVHLTERTVVIKHYGKQLYDGPLDGAEKVQQPDEEEE